MYNKKKEGAGRGALARTAAATIFTVYVFCFIFVSANLILSSCTSSGIIQDREEIQE